MNEARKFSSLNEAKILIQKTYAPCNDAIDGILNTQSVQGSGSCCQSVSSKKPGPLFKISPEELYECNYVKKPTQQKSRPQIPVRLFSYHIFEVILENDQ